MKGQNKYIISIKTIILIFVLILSVLLPNLMFKHSKNSYATSLSSTIDTKLGTVTIETDETKVKKGDIVAIDVYVGGKNIRSFSADLIYDMELFEEIYIQQDIETISHWNVFKDGVNDTGHPIIALVASDLKYACTNEKIATIYLKAMENIENDIEITLQDIFITNTDFEDNEEGDNVYPDVSLTIKGSSGSGGEVDPPIEEPEKEYKITYNANITAEVNNIPENEIKEEKKEYIISGMEPYTIGYRFEGWNTSSDGTGTTYLPGDIYNIDKDLTLYAQWKDISKLETLYLSSETYKIGNIDITQYQEGDKYISRVTKETTLKDFINNLETNGDVVQVIKRDGQLLTDNEYVGTGMKLVVTKGTESIELQIAVKGDLSGDGKVTVTDLSTLNQTVLKLISLQNEYRIAGDLDENNNITATDLSTLNKMILKII